ncbi:MAG: hypothetical protein ACM3JJ_12685 [Hyphomicrobiales bacterium]
MKRDHAVSRNGATIGRGRRRIPIVALALCAVFLSSGLGVPDAGAIPAFARKYGLACTGCHEAWPTLNDFGRAFRDRGYQMGLGEDAPTKVAPAYWPISIRITPHYEYDSANHQTTDQGVKTLGSGGFSEVGLDLLSAGTLARNVSFLVVPTGFTTSEGVTLEAAWIRFENLHNSGWLNFKLGKHELDLPRSEHRSWSLTDTGYLIYGYHPPGSISEYDLAENERGIEYTGHDRGSFNRVALSIFNVQNSPGSRNAFDTPGIYAHASHKWLWEGRVVSSARLGFFGTYSTWPTTSLTSGGEPIDGAGGDLKRATKVGVEGHVWMGPEATPLHATIVAARGEDSPGLIPGAVRDATFSGGFLELGYTPTLWLTAFGRYDLIRNQTQGIPGNPKSLNDEDAVTLGVRRTIHFSSRAEFAVHAEYSDERIRGGADDGSDLRLRTAFAGFDFGY